MNSEILNELSKNIKSPVPFWFLNGYVDEWHIIKEFEMMKEKGIGDVIVHPRYGLQVEYLSEEWFKIFGWCVREAKRHGMHVWIYDELNWPSGTAGMRVMQVNQDYQGKYLAVEAKPINQIDIENFDFGDYVIAADIESGQVTKTLVISQASEISGLPDDWLIFNCTVKRDPYYIDTLSWDAVNCFKHITYDAYYERFGDEFGKTIRAVFTDEPSIYWVSVGYDDWNLPYTSDFFETFEHRYGYPAIPNIPYLFYSGFKGLGFRADFWEHAGYLFNERYHSNLGNWCREHNIIYTGHNNHEEPLRYQIRFQGDMFGTMRTMDIPGVDHLGKQTLGNSFISIIGHKICSSEAHISNKARCMSESFGLMDWDTTYTNLKRVTDWQYALGINLLIPHAIYHTISGMTKRECPPSFFYQSPHWEDFGDFGDYVKRLEEMLCGGKHLCKVAILYPATGLWQSYQTDKKTSDFEHIDNFLHSLCLELIKNQIDFDIIDMVALQKAEFKNKNICLADECYQMLIVPSTHYLRPSEVIKLRQIAQAEISLTIFYRAMEPLPENLPSGLREANFVQSADLETFVEVLKKQIDEDIQIVGGGAEDIMAYRREKDGRKITFLLNRSEKHRKVIAMIKDYPDPAIYNQETDSYTKLTGRQAGRKFQAELRFQPNQSYFIVSNCPNAPEVPEITSEPVPISIENLNVNIPFNVASLYHFQFTPVSENEQSHGQDIDVRTNPRFIPVNWDTNPPSFEQFAGTYETRIEVNCNTENIDLILDKDYADCEVYLNGNRIELSACCSSNGNGAVMRPFLTDFQDLYAHIGHILKSGENVFKVISPTKLSEPIRLVGSFRTIIKGKDAVLEKLDGTNLFKLELDYPFYSGTVTYTAEFNLEKNYKSLILNLHNVRDSAAVYINGKPAGKRLWAPFILEIAPLSKIGKNELKIEVRNNMTNLIQGNPRPLGLTDKPTLAGFE